MTQTTKCLKCGGDYFTCPCTKTIEIANKLEGIRKQKATAAEGLLDSIQGKTKSEAVADIVRFAEKIYTAGRQHEREELHAIANQN